METIIVLHVFKLCNMLPYANLFLVYVVLHQVVSNIDPGAIRPARCGRSSATMTVGPSWKPSPSRSGSSAISPPTVTVSVPIAIDCPKAATLYEAAKECTAQGFRLCTAEELSNCCGTGCQYDSYRVWTSTPCSPPLWVTRVPTIASSFLEV